MVYLTFNDSPGGVYKSQVTDVCKYLSHTFSIDVKLIAMVSARHYWADRSKIKKLYKNSVVLPMYPGIGNWQKNKFLLNSARLIMPKDNVIARGVFATLLARDCGSFNKVIFDARGAYMAEWNEYLQAENKDIAKEMIKLESRAVLDTHYRIAVSTKLVDYWRESFRYMSSYHVVIPCTLNDDVPATYNADKAAELRTLLGVTETEVLLVYSGSSARWQSLTMLEGVMTTALKQNPALKLLMLCQPESAQGLIQQYPGRVIQKWLSEEEVHEYLCAADYGLLLREPSVTNQVSSPVKFAEYLAAGLPVIISNDIGDYTEFVEQQQCGSAIENTNWALLNRPDINKKKNMQVLAEQYFRKQNYEFQYRKLIQ